MGVVVHIPDSNLRQTLDKPEHKRVGSLSKKALDSFEEGSGWEAAVVRLLQTEAVSVTSLVGKAQKLFECDGYDGGIVCITDRFIFFSQSVLPKDKAVDKPIAGLRVTEYDHAILGEARGFWPPPIVDPQHDGRASWCWEAVATSAGEDKEWSVPEEALEELVTAVGGRDWVAFRQVRDLPRSLTWC